MSPFRASIPLLLFAASTASASAELAVNESNAVAQRPASISSEPTTHTEDCGAGDVEFDEHALVDHDHERKLLAGSDLAVVERRGYTVQELANIHEYSRKREKKLQVAPPSTAPKTKLRTALGAIEVTSLHILERYIPGQITARLGESFDRAAKIMATWKFPVAVQQAPYAWKMFVKDSNAQHRVSGFMSSERCHSAWMGPPANLFVVADRFLTQCGSNRRRMGTEVVAAFDETMVHEIAHAVEFQLMGRGFGRRQRWHSEGFATWFESLPALDAPPNGPIRSARFDQLVQEARQAFDPNWNPSVFGGSKSDYARSFGMLATLAGRHSPETVFAVYRRMSDENIRFDEAVERVTGWGLEHWIAETELYLNTAPTHSASPTQLVRNQSEAAELPTSWDDLELLPDLTDEF